MIPRKKGLKRTPVKRVNVTRRASSFARCYGSKERVEWIKSLPCVICRTYGEMQRHETDNAHTENGGRGRKGPYQSIVPLCRRHHEDYDGHKWPFDTPVSRKAIQEYAVFVENEWQDQVADLASRTKKANG